jgi:chromosome segregation protein
LLKLKKLQLQGFKSFADKTELFFNGSGISAVVGPNGCGKSNISDAIAWVLGEQSPKSLRGGRMEDVIFNGTRARLPLGLAEVSVTLVDPEAQRESNQPVLEEPDTIEESITDADFEEPEEGAISDPSETAQDSTTLPPAGPAMDAVVPEIAALEIVLPDGTTSSVRQPAQAGLKRKRRPKMQLRPGELVVSRRLFRSGDSEYLINGRLVRLRDVQDLFMGTGLGPDSYAIIEQGRVGMILSSKPSDRRAIIEEAAGITKFKAKRKLAESKLEQARQNLLRINDITEEVSRQLGSLKRQAAKAKRYRELRDRMRELARDLFNARALEIQNQQQQCQSVLDAITLEHQAKRETIGQHETAYHVGNEGIYAREDALRQARGQLSQLELDLVRGQQKVQFQKQQSGQLTVRIQENSKEIERLAGQEAHSQQEASQKEEALAEATHQFERIDAEFQRQNSQVQSAQSELSRLEASSEQSRESLIDCVENAATLRNQMLQLDDLERRLDNQISRLTLEQEEASSQHQQMAETHQQTTRQLAEQQTRLSGLRQQSADATRRLAGLKEELLLAQDQLQQARESHSATQHRLKSLEELAAHHAYSTEAVRMLLGVSAKEDGAFQTGGILADHVEVEAPYEAAVEEYLKQELEYLLVDSENSLREGFSILRQRSAGRSTFLVCDDGRDAHNSQLDQLIKELTGNDESLIPLVDIVHFPGQYRGIFAEALPHLFRTIMIPSLERGLELARRYPTLIFLTPEGEVVRGRLVSGGGKASRGHLSLKREIRELEKKVQTLQKAMAEHEEKLQVLRGLIQEKEGESTGLLKQIQDLEKQLFGAELHLEQLQRELERARQRQNLASLELERTRQEKQQLENRRIEYASQIEAAEQKKSQIEQQIHGQQESLRQLKDQSSQDSQLLSELRSQLATFRERKQSAEVELHRLAQALRECRERLSHLNQQTHLWSREIEELQASTRQLEELTFQQAVQKASLEAEIRTQEAGLQEAREAQAALEQVLKAERQELEGIQNQKTAVEVERARLHSDFIHLEETCEKELGVPLRQIQPETPVVLEEAELERLDEEYVDLKNKTEAMGPVNMMALEEYQECDQRYQFLMTQRQDLMDSIEDTTAAIKEIDQVSREQFREAFIAINQNFQGTFTVLFGGGHGEMKLLDELDELDSGIEIIAQPPGKKLQNVLLLSGGEKALTAIALLLAIFRYQPSPFCVLDEVDAPLDELNTSRFAQMVQGMSQGTQFLIITHSKRTMEAADTMYGVTMQEAGVSKLVSVQFGRTA